ncbi:MAG: ribosomal protein S18 acetylase RimI-like enzyme [Candidatus Azotimanducaceae bacterium]|jgi:ribosomal protein S18 acetylase RimI-like enzyme
MTLVYSQNCDIVDWPALRDDLIQDDFHNNRTNEQLQASFDNSFICVFVLDDNRCVATARALSDEICNCYVVDVWTQSAYRKRGVANRMMQMIIDAVPGQHIYLQTDDAQLFYEKLGFAVQPDGMFRISGEWLNNTRR